jgi:hypothetical protein
MIFVSQALYFLRRYCSALRLDDFDGGLYLCRSMYEAVLRIRYLKYEPQKAEIFLALSGVEIGLYDYKRKGNRTDWNILVDKNTGVNINVNLSNHKMASASGKRLDVDVYAILFRYMSKFVDPNVDTLNKHFSEETGFAIHVDDNPFEGLLICSFVLILLFSELSQLNCFSVTQKRDARFACKKIARILLSIESQDIQVFPGTFACVKEKVKDAIQEAA